MSPLIEQLLLTALALALPATVSLFVGEPRRPRLRGSYRALLAAGLVAGAALVLGAVAGGGAWPTLAVAGVLGVVVLAFGPVGRPWSLRGLLAWSLTITAGAAYLVGVVVWMAGADLGFADLLGSSVLWVLELFVFVLVLGHVWELVDVLARWDWHRRAELDRWVEVSAGRRRGPFVSLHVPTSSEPPDLVIETLRRLVELEYDDFEVLVVDTNTDDPELWRPVERFCRSHEKLGFFHVEDRPGFRAGALNIALEKVDPRTQIVGVVDADCHVDPDFLSRCVPLFDDEDLAFVQTRQDHRDSQVDPYFRRLYHFCASFDVAQRSRNERNAAILGGTMGLISRDALVEIGGWDEWCVSEDAELSLRLLEAGWSGVHVDRSFGRGILPLTFEALKRERFRSAFGGVQLLRLHWRSLLPGRRTEANRLSPGQRWAHLSGGVQWFGGLAGLLFTGFLLLGAADALSGDGLVVRPAPLLVGLVGLVVLGWLRSVALLRRTKQVAWREAAGALGLWSALGWVVALASVRGLVARQGAVLRTPKVRGDVSWREALRGNRVEALLALLCLVGAAAGAVATRSDLAGGLVVALLLVVQCAGYAAAPVSSLAAMHADLTPELRRRRRELAPSWSRVAPGVRRWGIGPVLAAAAAAAAVLLVSGPFGAPGLDDLGGHGGSAARPVTPRLKVAAPSQPLRTPLSPLSPLVALATSTTPAPAVSASPSARPAAATPRPGAATGPTSTVVPSSTPTAQPVPVRAHGRPTSLPPKPVPTKRH